MTHNDDPRNEWRRLVEQVQCDDDVSLDALESAIRAADAVNQEEAAYELRSAMISACQGRGRPDLILAHFPWCLAHAKTVSPLEHEKLLFRYRWAISQTMDYPSIGRPRVEELIDDMADRYQQAGFSLRSVWVLKILMSRYWRDQRLAEEAIDSYWRFPRDAFSDTLDTERKFVAMAQLKFWPERHAERIAAMTIQNQIQRCQLKAAILLPLLELGKRELALQQHQEGWALVASDKTLFVDRSFHCQYLAMTGEHERAVNVLLSDLKSALRSIEVSEVVDFFFNAAWVFTQGGGPNGHTRIPQESPDASEQKAASLGDWCRRRASHLAEALDQQTRNGAIAGELQSLLKLKPLDASD